VSEAATKAQLPRLSPALAVELFATFNLAFLALDVFLAHDANDFADAREWAPVAFSAVAPLFLVSGLVLGIRRPWGKTVGLAVGYGSVLVGVIGLVLHLESAFFQRQTLRDLVYAAPFVAPLSYAGVGLLLVLNRLESDREASFGRWIALLAMGGFTGNFLLSLLDHAQNGFFYASEWVPVVAAAYGASFLLPVVLGERGSAYLRLCSGVLAVQAAVGIVGGALHVVANLDARADSLYERFIYGAPAFAPLLFVDLALLAGIGLWQIASTRVEPVLVSPP
jgi:hypothetical protein